MARRLNPSFKKFWGDELITEEKEDALLAAIYRHPKLPALPWRHTAARRVVDPVLNRKAGGVQDRGCS